MNNSAFLLIIPQFPRAHKFVLLNKEQPCQLMLLCHSPCDSKGHHFFLEA